MDQTKAEAALRQAIQKLDAHIGDFTGGFPDSQSDGYIYPKVENTSWTGSFYTAMLWLAYEYTHDKKYLPVINGQLESFRERIEKRLHVDTHDLGFLYTLSCVAAYKLTGDMQQCETALRAADTLLERYKPKGEFIQAWGSIHDPACYRLIIDCLLNLPLLYWATEQSGDPKYRDIAYKHLKTAMKVLFRADGSTFHTHYFDPETGEPTKGTTFQGYSDDSCWARGQAWGIYGLALSYAYTHDADIPPLLDRTVAYFAEHLPADKVPYWDMIFADGSGQPRDTSAASIAACGLLEFDRQCNKPEYVALAYEMLDTLCDHYTTADMPHANGLLTNGMYNRNEGHQPESTIFGDYYYMEALIRIVRPDWKTYW